LLRRHLAPPQQEASADLKSALAGFIARSDFIDDVNAAFAANHAVIAVAALQSSQRIFYFHFFFQLNSYQLIT